MTFTLASAGVDLPANLLTLLKRQADGWISGDFSRAIADWHPDGVLLAPGHRIPVANIMETVRQFHANFVELAIAASFAFASQDGSRFAFEWEWSVTRRSDNVRSTTPDAIIVELEGSLIRSWREYFDTAVAVE